MAAAPGPEPLPLRRGAAVEVVLHGGGSSGPRGSGRGGRGTAWRRYIACRRRQRWRRRRRRRRRQRRRRHLLFPLPGQNIALADAGDGLAESPPGDSSDVNGVRRLSAGLNVARSPQCLAHGRCRRLVVIISTVPVVIVSAVTISMGLCSQSCGPTVRTLLSGHSGLMLKNSVGFRSFPVRWISGEKPLQSGPRKRLCPFLFSW
ncbi:uncharacterized protein LOC122209761 isoform X1 [Panthera leo]|uniref:uncharacterized protein LOC122209761 isoform X1 n=1 Tax=Panthera leo TaxID=9689 RepID=UPI001C6954A3|nr:uncharacterized protein LOC122209761 isoform X1 [Panthera leo]